MTVRALLRGHEFDLQTLVDIFPNGDPSVVSDQQGRYHLEAGELDAHMDDPGHLVEAAERLLNDLVGAARLTHSNFRPVNLAGSFERVQGLDKAGHATDSAVGRDRVVVARAEPAMIRIGAQAATAATHPDGKVVTPEPSGKRHLRLARTHSDVAELLTLIGNSDMGWADLYKSFEIVRDSSKRGRYARFSLDQLGYRKSDVDNFTQSVNLHRHARPSSTPKRELSLAEAQEFIRDMAERWFHILDGNA